MAEIISFAAELPIDAFDPQPDAAKLATISAIVGTFISSMVVHWFLRGQPYPAATNFYVWYFFDIVLLFILVFGVGLIVTGWLIAWNPVRHDAFGRTMLRASHIALVFAIALHEYKN